MELWLARTTPSIPSCFTKYELPEAVRALVILVKNPVGRITNSDLEMTGMFLLLLVIWMVVPSLDSKQMALLDDKEQMYPKKFGKIQGMYMSLK